jgi:hypothetical protein
MLRLYDQLEVAVNMLYACRARVPAKFLLYISAFDRKLAHEASRSFNFSEINRLCGRLDKVKEVLDSGRECERTAAWRGSLDRFYTTPGRVKWLHHVSGKSI